MVSIRAFSPKMAVRNAWKAIKQTNAGTRIKLGMVSALAIAVDHSTKFAATHYLKQLLTEKPSKENLSYLVDTGCWCLTKPNVNVAPLTLLTGPILGSILIKPEEHDTLFGKMANYGASLFAGGVMSNSIDILLRGGAVDLGLLYFNNLADISILIGLAMYLVGHAKSPSWP